MAEDTNVEQAVLPATPEIPKITAKMSGDEVLTLVTTYMNNADASLGKLQQNIEKLSEQLNKLQQMRLMVAGQRELVADLYSKLTGTELNAGQQTQEAK